MGSNKLAHKLMNAYITGNVEEVDRIKDEISKRAEYINPKKDNNVININTVLNDDKSSAISVYDFLNKTFGADWWEWEFETIEQLLWKNYGVALEDINRDKVWAIRHLCRSDNAFADWFEFNQLALSFSGCIADFEQLRSISPGMIINTVNTLLHIRPDRESSFSNEVIKYICVILKEYGVYVPPPSLMKLIGEEMKKIISTDTVAEWENIIKRYRAIVGQKVEKIEENMIDIQAKRLIKAEASALEYGSK